MAHVSLHGTFLVLQGAQGESESGPNAAPGCVSLDLTQTSYFLLTEPLREEVAVDLQEEEEVMEEAAGPLEEEAVEEEVVGPQVEEAVEEK